MKVPDIGDFHDVPIIEILVKPGDVIKAEQSLVTLESDKAAMDVPSPAAGIVREVLAKIGDKVSMGSPILTLEDSAAPGGKTGGAGRETESGGAEGRRPPPRAARSK